MSGTHGDTWKLQCIAARVIRTRYGVSNALDYIVGEKLLLFAELSEKYPACARQLPQFVSEVRALFEADDLRAYLNELDLKMRAKLRLARKSKSAARLQACTQERARLERLRDPLTSATLGTS